VSAAPLVDPHLAGCGVVHGFGVRGCPEPPGLARPTQVHGARVVTADECLRAAQRPEADAVVSAAPGVAVGVLTADCVPLLLATRDGRAVAAVHAGWRGIACGVVEAGAAALCDAAGVAPEELLGALGPHIGPCCYEVDAPVIEALEAHLPGGLTAALRPARPGHAMLDLGAAVRSALAAAGLPTAALAAAAASCTSCDAERFHSHRRDGARAGRLVHFIAPAAPRVEA